MAGQGNVLHFGTWTAKEDRLLIQLVEVYGTKNWKLVASRLPGRLGKQCRERWINQLDPEVYHQPFTEAEWRTLLQAHSVYGTKWSDIVRSGVLPNRSANQLKNHWNYRVRQQNIRNVGRIKRVRSWKHPLYSDSPSVSYDSDYENYIDGKNVLKKPAKYPSRGKIQSISAKDMITTSSNASPSFEIANTKPMLIPLTLSAIGRASAPDNMCLDKVNTQSQYITNSPTALATNHTIDSIVAQQQYLFLQHQQQLQAFLQAGASNIDLAQLQYQQLIQLQLFNCSMLSPMPNTLPLNPLFLKQPDPTYSTLSFAVQPIQLLVDPPMWGNYHSTHSTATHL